MSLRKLRIQDIDWDYYKEVVMYFDAINYYSTNLHDDIKNSLFIAKANYIAFAQSEPDATEQFIDDWLQLKNNIDSKEILTDLHYDSLIISLYSFVEKKMKFLADYLSVQYEIKPSDIGGKGIFKYRIYLEKVCKITFNDIEKEWKTLLGYNQLRNMLIHSDNNRFLNLRNNSLVSFLKGLDGVELVDYQDGAMLYFTNSNVVHHFVSITKEIIHHLYFEDRKQIATVG